METHRKLSACIHIHIYLEIGRPSHQTRTPPIHFTPCPYPFGCLIAFCLVSFLLHMHTCTTRHPASHTTLLYLFPTLSLRLSTTISRGSSFERTGCCLFHIKGKTTPCLQSIVSRYSTPLSRTTIASFVLSIPWIFFYFTHPL